MNKVLRITLVLSIFLTNMFGSELSDRLDKVWTFLDQGLIQSIATLLLVVAGLTLAFGNVEKGKVYLWSIVIGISIVYGARGIAELVF